MTPRATRVIGEAAPLLEVHSQRGLTIVFPLPKTRAVIRLSAYKPQSIKIYGEVWIAILGHAGPLQPSGHEARDFLDTWKVKT